MGETLRNAWRVPELRKKLIYTFLMLLLFRLIGVVPVPGIDLNAIQSSIANYDALGLVNMMTGNQFSQMTIMAMGITPYINASIIMQLLCVAIPALEKLQKDGGEEGRKKINRITRYSTVVLAALQAIGIIAGLNGLQSSYKNFWGYCTVGIIMAGGTALAMWIGERITKNGIGNGISLLIFAGIISNLFNGIVAAVSNVFSNIPGAISSLLIILATTIIIVAVVTFVDRGERRIPVQYAKRVVGRKMYGGQSTFLPMKVNMSGVMPIIFASSIGSLPATIAGLAGKATEGTWVETWFGNSSIPYAIIYFLLIIFFAYFYSTIQFNPIEVSNNLKKNGGYIPGFRPGKPTSEFIQKVLNKITLFGAIYLGIIAVVPILISHFSNAAQLTGLSLGGTSIMIAVGVALETVRALEAQMLMRNYKGFLD